VNRVARNPIATVNEYMAAQPEPARAVLERVRASIRKAMPMAEEKISYNIPCYRQGNRNLLYFAGFKEHCSLYPVDRLLLEQFGDEIAPYVAGKGTLRFSLGKKPPLGLIGRIARFRARAGFGPTRESR
jgi:uncharacterized protein YdhG (YjbR/CyaY superfamily)